MNYIAVSPQGIFIDEGDGVYRYNSGIRSKLIQFDTVYKDRFNELSIGSDYLSTGLKVRKSKNEEGGLNFYIYDIKADSTIYLTINSLNVLAHPFVFGHTLFVGGAFYLKDGSADVRNIGAYDLRQKKWYDLAGGVCGPVHAIAEMNGSMYVGGEFSTVGKK